MEVMTSIWWLLLVGGRARMVHTEGRSKWRRRRMDSGAHRWAPHWYVPYHMLINSTRTRAHLVIDRNGLNPDSGTNFLSYACLLKFLHLIDRHNAAAPSSIEGGIVVFRFKCFFLSFLPEPLALQTQNRRIEGHRNYRPVFHMILVSRDCTPY